MRLDTRRPDYGTTEWQSGAVGASKRGFHLLIGFLILIFKQKFDKKMFLRFISAFLKNLLIQKKRDQNKIDSTIEILFIFSQLLQKVHLFFEDFKIKKN